MCLNKNTQPAHARCVCDLLASGYVERLFKKTIALDGATNEIRFKSPLPPGAGEKGKEMKGNKNMRRFNVDLPVKLGKKVEKVARETGLPYKAIFILALTEYIEKLNKGGEK